MLVKSKSVNNGVQKRKEERDYDSVLIGEEIQLGFRVFFGLGFFFCKCVCFSLLSFAFVVFYQPTPKPNYKPSLEYICRLIYCSSRGPNRVNIPIAAQRNFDTLLGFIGCVYNFI